MKSLDAKYLLKKGKDGKSKQGNLRLFLHSQAISVGIDRSEGLLSGSIHRGPFIWPSFPILPLLKTFSLSRES